MLKEKNKIENELIDVLEKENIVNTTQESYTLKNCDVKKFSILLKESETLNQDIFYNIKSALVAYNKYKNKAISYDSIKQYFNKLGIDILETDDENTIKNYIRDIINTTLFNKIENYLKEKGKLSQILSQDINGVRNNIISALNSDDFYEIISALENYNDKYIKCNQFLYNNLRIYLHNNINNSIKYFEEQLLISIKDNKLSYNDIENYFYKINHLENAGFEIDLTSSKDKLKIISRRFKEMTKRKNSFIDIIQNLNISDEEKMDMINKFKDVYQSTEKEFIDRKNSISIDSSDALSFVNKEYDRIDLDKIKKDISDLSDLAKSYNYDGLGQIVKYNDYFNKNLFYDGIKRKNIYDLEISFRAARDDSFTVFKNDKFKNKFYIEQDKLLKAKQDYCKDIKDFKLLILKEKEKLNKFIESSSLDKEELNIKHLIANNKITKKDINNLNKNLINIYLKEQEKFKESIKNIDSFDNKISFISKREHDMKLNNILSTYKKYNYSNIYMKLTDNKNISSSNVNKLNNAFNECCKHISEMYQKDKATSTIYIWTQYSEIKDCINYINNDEELKNKVEDFKYIIDNVRSKEEHDKYLYDLNNYLKDNDKDIEKVHFYLNCYNKYNNKKIPNKKPNRRKVVKVDKNIVKWIKNNKLKSIVCGLSILVTIPLVLQAIMVTNSNLYSMLSNNSSLSDAGVLCNILHHINTVLAKISSLGSAKFDANGLWKIKDMPIYNYYNNIPAYLLQVLSRLGVSATIICQLKKHTFNNLKLSLIKEKLKNSPYVSRKYKYRDYLAFSAMYRKYENKDKKVLLREILNFMIEHNIKSLSGLEKLIEFYGNKDNYKLLYEFDIDEFYNDKINKKLCKMENSIK